MLRRRQTTSTSLVLCKEEEYGHEVGILGTNVAFFIYYVQLENKYTAEIDD